VSKRSTVVIVVLVVAVVLWLGEQAVWNMILAMHGRGR
jgi:hypothetical protein